MSMLQFLGEWSLRSSVLILAGALLLWLLRVKNPSMRLTAWTAVLAGSLAIPLLVMTVPKLPLVVWRAPAKPSATPAAVSHQPEIALPTITNLGPTPASAGDLAAMPSDSTRLAAVVYTLMAVALLGRLFVGLIVSLRILRRSRPTGMAADGAEVRESGHVASPVTVGVVRPAILLPVDWHAWDSAKLDAVLAHERSHVRRRDPAVQFLSAIHRALLWASPLTWFLDGCIIRAAEELSDDDAVAATRDRASYAEILLEFMQRGVGDTKWAGVPMARYDRPEKRIRRILNSAAIPSGITRWGVAAILTMGGPLAYLVAAAHPQSAPRPVSVPVQIPRAQAPAQAVAPTPTPKPAPLAEPVLVAQQPARSPAQAKATPAPQPEFEVVSIKPIDPNVMHRVGLQVYPGGRVVIHTASLKSLIVTAFGLSYWQISGGDEWTGKDNYDIEAKPSETMQATVTDLRYSLFAIEDENLRQMLQALLIDRFQLKFHRATKTGD
ncbi:MAG: M56 family metallopeptidase, partial [Bryobacteraceae bacterium]